MRVFLIILALFLQIGWAKEGNFTWQNLEKIEQLCLYELEKEPFNIVKVKDRCLEAAINFENKKDFNTASWYYLLGGEYKRDLSFLKDKITKNFAKANIAHAFILSGDFEKAKKLYSSFLANEDPYWANSAMQKDYETLRKIYPKEDKNLQKGLEIWKKLFKPYIGYKNLYEKYVKAKKEKNYLAAAIYLQEATNLLKKQNFIIYENYFDMGIAYYNAKNYQKALEFFKKAQIGYEKKDDIETLKSLANLYGWIGDSYYNLANYKDAIVFYNKKLNLFKMRLQGHYKRSELAYLLYQLSNFYLDAKEYQNSIIIAKKAIKIYNEIKKYDILPNLYRNIANSFYNLKNYQKAIAYYQKKIQSSKKLKKYSQIDFANDLFDLMITYYYNKEYKKALEIALKAHTIYKKAKDYRTLSNLDSWIGDIYLNHYESKGFDKSKRFEFFINKAIKYFKEQKHYFLKAILQNEAKEDQYCDILNNLYLSYKNIFQPQKALIYAKELEKIYKENNNTQKLSQLYLNMAKDYDGLDLQKKSFNYLLKKIELDKALYNKESFEMAKNYYNLALNLAALKEYKKGSNYCQKALNILDNISKNDNEKIKAYAITYLWWEESCQYVNNGLKVYKYKKKAKKNLLQKNYKEAIKNFKYAYYASSYKNGDYNVNALNNLISIADTYMLLKNHKKALFYYKKAFHIIYKATLGLNEPWKIVRKVGNKIVNVYKKMGNYKKACHYLELINKYQAKSLKEFVAETL